MNGRSGLRNAVIFQGLLHVFESDRRILGNQAFDDLLNELKFFFFLYAHLLNFRGFSRWNNLAKELKLCLQLSDNPL